MCTGVIELGHRCPLIRHIWQAVETAFGNQYKYTPDQTTLTDLLSMQSHKVYASSDDAVQLALLRATFYNDKSDESVVWTFSSTDKSSPAQHFRVPTSTPTSQVIGAYCLRNFKKWTTAHFTMDMHMQPLATGILHCNSPETVRSFSCVVAI